LAVVIEPLGKWHKRETFSCGNQQLDEWFRHRSGQDERRNVARVFVAVDDQLGIVGFYSLGSLSLVIDDLPQEIARKLPRYEAIPAALIGRLARATPARGRGIGTLLLADAVRRILGASSSLAVFAIVVDAKDEQAVVFYESFGFQAFPARPRRLFLLTSTAAKGFARASD
jgi:GNAT superfamily N-acetyltransferase